MLLTHTLAGHGELRYALAQQREHTIPSGTVADIHKAEAHPESSAFEVNFHDYDALLQRASVISATHE